MNSNPDQGIVIQEIGCSGFLGHILMLFSHRNNRTRMRTLLFGDSFCASRMGGKDGSLGWQKEA